MQFSVSVCLCLLLGVGLVTAAPSELTVEEQQVAALPEFSPEEQDVAALSEEHDIATPSEVSSEEQDSDDEGVNLPRVTCDLLSFSFKGFSVNHSACAAHCLLRRKKFRGGRCINGVCSCRK
ncbi:defensin-like [Homalodisca vitripennis]|uniref:defensin-like n=1 Tax=Homalodisca vitripennis TaxID=197043 RepID=UPI001EEC0DF6|nr:defensin-like [Homalodisca vitripennis]